jgi:hypothetical protein
MVSYTPSPPTSAVFESAELATTRLTWPIKSSGLCMGWNTENSYLFILFVFCVGRCRRIACGGTDASTQESLMHLFREPLLFFFFHGFCLFLLR